MYLENVRAPIPKEGTRVISSGEVQAKVYNKTGSRRVWTTIGRLPETGPLHDEFGRKVMIPNGVYRYWYGSHYRSEVSDLDPDNYPPFFENGATIGPFALVLGAVTKSGLYDTLIDVFGVEDANAILDIALYYNWGERLDLDRMDRTLEDQVVFSGRPHSAEWYKYELDPSQDEESVWDDGGDDDDFDFWGGWGDDEDDEDYPRRRHNFPPKGYDEGITEERIQEFMRRWTALRQKTDPRDTAIHLNATGAGWIQRFGGYSEPEKHGIVAVCETGGEYPGLPLAYHLYSGYHLELSDAQEAADLFQELGLKPKRIITEAPLLRPEFLTICETLQLPWLVLLQDDFLAHETMLKRYEEALYQGHGTPITARDPMVAVAEDNVLLFGPGTPEPDRRGFVGLYCISYPAIEEREYMKEKLDKTYQEASTALDQLQNGDGENPLPIPQPAEGGAKPCVKAEDEDEDDEDETPEKQALSALYDAVRSAGGLFYSPNQYAWDCLKLEYHPEEGRYRLVIDEEMHQYYRCRGCYFTVASSEPMDLQTISDDFPLSLHLGDSDLNPAFSAIHLQLNSETDGSFDTWLFLAYIADIVRALLMPSFRQFEAAKDGEVRDVELRDFSEEDKKDWHKVMVSIGRMIRWLDTVQFRRFDVDGELAYYGYTRGVREDVLEAAGIQVDILPRFRDLVVAAEDPYELKELRQQKRTIPNKRGRPKGSKNKPKQDTGKG